MNASSATLYQRAALELLRALRGRRSQVALARRLGYRGNPITDWERGESRPTLRETLRVALLVKAPVLDAFRQFVSLPPPTLSDPLDGLHVWLDALRADLSIVELAERIGRSRYTVGRWLSGRTEPRLSEWLELVDAITDRVHDWVAALVAIDEVPSLLAAHRRATAARSIAFQQPWTEGVLRVLETEHYRQHPGMTHGTLAAWLGVSLPVLQSALDGLVEAGILERRGTHYESLRPLSVDMRAGAGSLQALQRHWLGVAQQRTAEPAESDWFGYNVLSCSRDDLGRIRESLRRTYQEARAIVAASQPTESVALLVMNLATFPPPGQTRLKPKPRGLRPG